MGACICTCICVCICDAAGAAPYQFAGPVHGGPSAEHIINDENTGAGEEAVLVHFQAVLAEVGRALARRLFEIHADAFARQLPGLSQRDEGHLQRDGHGRREAEPAAL